MKGLDDGPDGLNEAAFDRALGLRRAARLPQHTLLLERAQAIVDGDHRRVALCDVALGRMPDVASISPDDALRLCVTSKREANEELATGRTRRSA